MPAGKTAYTLECSLLWLLTYFFARRASCGDLRSASAERMQGGFLARGCQMENCVQKCIV